MIQWLQTKKIRVVSCFRRIIKFFDLGCKGTFTHYINKKGLAGGQSIDGKCLQYTKEGGINKMIISTILKYNILKI